ncbi:MAG: hypothetical protein GY755_14805 [Chloroflexi bacterium]|nr:hypothetical protein [Chloroflexota bacterium]
MRKIIFLTITLAGFVVSCMSQRTHVYTTATSTDIPSIVLTQLAKPISTPTINNISRKAYDFQPSPTPTPTATPDLERRKVEEIAVYSAFLKDICMDSVNIQFIVLEEASYQEGIEDRDILQIEPSLSVQTLDDYRRNNQNKILSPEIFPENSFCKFISSEEVAVEMDDWNNEYWLINFSTIGFNEKFNQAIVFSGYYCGKLCAGNTLYILARDENGWVVKQSALLWIS